MKIKKQLQMVMEQNASMANVADFLAKLDSMLATTLDELNEATEENAVAVCKSVAERLDQFYQAL